MAKAMLHLVLFLFGSKEARELNLFDKSNNLREIKSAESVDTDTIMIKLK